MPQFVHPPRSLEINFKHSQLECIKIFNNHKFFISYDSITFLSALAALCGCVSIVKKVDGLNKQEWLNTWGATLTEYLKSTGEPLYGWAYGAEEVEFALNTLHLVKDQWVKIVKFSKEKYITPFINDINNWDENINTIMNNFY